MGHGGPYSKRLSCWPHRHAGGDRGHRSRGRFPRPSFDRGGTAVGREHLLVRRERKQANQAVREAKRREADATALKARQAALVSFAAKLTPSELNYLLMMGAVPPSQMVFVPSHEAAHRVQTGTTWRGDPIYEERRLKVEASISPVGDLAKHYPKGVIPRGDLAVLQQGA